MSERTSDRTEEWRARRERKEREREERARAIRERDRFEGLQVDPDVDYYEDVARREPGDTNIVRWGFDLHPHVTFASAGFLIVFLGLTLAFQEQAERVFADSLSFIGDNFGWFYILSANIFLIAIVFFGFSRFGRIRLGGPDAKPEFTDFAWYAMLISAGMGIGLLFWSVAEPIYHFQTPAPFFDAQPETSQAAEAAMVTTFYHWGFHPWGIYALVSLALAFFTFNRGLPLTMRSVFYPILGERIYGFWGNLIDTVAVIATLFGLASSLGFGVKQVSAGMNFLFSSPDNVGFQVVLITVITGMATLSVVAGLDGGVKRLSQVNLNLGALFLAFILIVGPTVFIVGTFLESSGSYLQALPSLSLWTESLSGSNWQSGWTVFYWGWWISWAPFVGMFIARVSKGRTIREFVIGVVLMPTLLSFLWMSAFGGAALKTQLDGTRDVAAAVNTNVATALFDLLEAFPLTTLTSFVGIILVVSFFVTSSDSGSLVVDHLTSGGKLESPVPQRVFWAIMEGAIAAILLIGGGLQALQSAAVASGALFAAVLLVAIYSMRQGFGEELETIEIHEEIVAAMEAGDIADVLAEQGLRSLAVATVETEE